MIQEQLFRTFVLVCLGLYFTAQASANIKVIATIPDLAIITKEIGGEHVDVESIAKGTQDPHAIEAKPSYMVKLSRADLLIAIGLDLEVGWLPSLQRGARNPGVLDVKRGYLEVGPLVDRIELSTGPMDKMSRKDGDVHPLGNPHVTLDPVRVGQIALKIAERLGELDPTHQANYLKNGQALQKRLLTKSEEWMRRIQKTGIKKVVTYHKTLNYFLSRYGIEAVAILEPKPGIPPTSGHVLKVIESMKARKVNWVLIENYFDSSPGKKIKESIPDARVVVLPVAVDGVPEVKSLDDLFETIVKALEASL